MRRPTDHKISRQSVSLPSRIARRVRAFARTRRTSQSRVIVDLIESGPDAKKKENRHYFDLLERRRRTEDTGEQQRITEELARLTFGE